MEKNYYEVLGVNPKCSSDEIENAYRGFLKNYDNPEIENEVTLKEVRAARELLLDEERRAIYDEGLIESGEMETPTSKEKIKKKSSGALRILKKILIFTIEICVTILVVVLIYLAITSIFQIGQIDGESMYPTYEHGDYLIFKKLGNEYEYDDVIIFEYTLENEQYFQDIYTEMGYELSNSNLIGNLHVKRIIGMPGDEIKVERNEVYVNGELVIESDVYMMSVEYTLAEDEYFVVGDNYDGSFDSRHHGPVTEEQIIGVALYSEKLDEFMTDINESREERKEEKDDSEE